MDGIKIEKVTSYNKENVIAEPDSETAGIVNITTKAGKAGTTTKVVIIITNPDKSRTTLNVDVTIK